MISDFYKKCIIIIPAYNEEPAIGHLISELHNCGFKNILVVDDGSEDNTAKIARLSGTRLIKHPVNCGKAAALQTGVKIVKNSNIPYLVTMDADGQHNPDDVVNIVMELEKGAPVVLGFRDFKKMPFLNKIANHIANILAFLVAGIWVKDSQCGLRGYKSSMAEFLFKNSKDFSHETNVIKSLAINKIQIKEVAVCTIYTKYSKSKKNKQGVVNGLKTAYRILFFQ